MHFIIIPLMPLRSPDRSTNVEEETRLDMGPVFVVVAPNKIKYSRVFFGPQYAELKMMIIIIDDARRSWQTRCDNNQMTKWYGKKHAKKKSGTNQDVFSARCRTGRHRSSLRTSRAESPLLRPGSFGQRCLTLVGDSFCFSELSVLDIFFLNCLLFLTTSWSLLGHFIDNIDHEINSPL